MPAGVGIIDSLFIALGVKVEGDGLTQVKAQVNEARESLLSAGAALKTFIAGFAIHEIAKIGSTFEQNQIQIAGFLSALGSSSDFNAGLKDAQGVIQQITKDAAILPGEAQEYIDVFKAGFPFVKAAMPAGAGLHDITNFTNQLTAIGKTFGLDSGLIAREFDHMLSPGKGMASLRLPLFRQLLAFMPTLKNGARQTAESFNAMTAPERLKVLQGTFSKLQPMLDASATSFDAMWGAAVSAVKQMTRIMTAPLFKGMKVALDQINGAFYDTNGELTDFGKSIVDAVGTATKYLTQFLGMIGHVVMWIAKSKVGAIAFKVAIGLLGTALTGLAVEKTVASFTKMLKVMTNLKSLMGGALFAAIALVAEDLYQFYTGGDSVTGLLVKKFPDAFKTAKDVVDGLWGAIKLLSPLLSMVGSALAEIASNADLLTAAIFVLGGIFAPEAALVAGIIYALNMLDQLIHKYQFVEKMLGLAVEEPEAVKGFKSEWGKPDAEDRPDFLTKIPSTIRKPVATAKPATWSPPSFGGSDAWSPASSPAMAAAGASVTNVTTDNSRPVMNFNITSTDPKEAGREVAAVIRNNRSKVHH